MSESIAAMDIGKIVFPAEISNIIGIKNLRQLFISIMQSLYIFAVLTAFQVQYHVTGEGFR